MNVPRKYPLLRVIALVLKVLAWIVLAAGLIGMIGLLVAGSGLPSDQQSLRPLATAGALTIPLVAILWFVELFAFGSILSLLIDIEENTRRPPHDRRNEAKRSHPLLEGLAGASPFLGSPGLKISPPPTCQNRPAKVNYTLGIQAARRLHPSSVRARIFQEHISCHQ